MTYGYDQFKQNENIMFRSTRNVVVPTEKNGFSTVLSTDR